MTIKYNIVLVLILLSVKALSQDTFENPQIINEKSGLPSDKVYSVLMDDNGFLWLSTDKGLCRWDGISVKIFQHNPADSTSISGNNIPRNAFCWDYREKQIIIGTENGLSIFDPHNLMFRNFIGNKDSSSAFLLSIHCIFIDRQNKLWLGTNNGIVNFNRGDGSFRLFPYSGNIPGGLGITKTRINSIFDIKQDVQNEQVLWLATLSGLVKFNKHSGEFFLFYYKANNYRSDLNAFNKLVAHSNQNLYLGTWNSDMVIFNTGNEKFEFSCGPNTRDKDCLFSRIVPFAEISPDKLWISSPHGIGIYNTLENNINLVKSFKNAGGKKFAPNIELVDNNKILCLTSEYGAYIYYLRNKCFTNYFMKPVDEEHWFLPTSLFEDTIEKKLYIGYARGEGIHYFDLQTNKFSVRNLPSRLIKEKIVRDISPFDANNLLIVCPDEIYKFSKKEGYAIPLHVKYKSNPNFTDIDLDKNGNIWVSSEMYGLQKLNVETGDLENIPKVLSYMRSKGVNPKIMGITIDKNNRIWFRSGFYYGYFDADNDSLQYFDFENIRVFCLYQDSPDTIWAGLYKKGLGFIDVNNPDKGIQLYKVRFDKNVLSIQRDNSGSFIFVTNDGVEKFSPGMSQPVIFNDNEGLVKYDKWENRDPTESAKLLKLSDGRFAIGYRRGVGFFYPDSLKKSKEQFMPYLSSVKIFEKEILPDKGLLDLKELKLDYNQNFLSFEYSALALINGNDIVFSHKLTGVDRNWVSSGHSNINYSNLQPGDSKFVVKAESKTDPGNVKKAVLNITILPPWWKTWWASSLFILVIILMIYSAYRFQLKRILEHKESIRLREVNELKSRLYANITHEFRTPLTVIKGMTNEIIDKMTKKEQQHFSDKLEMIERNSDKLLHLVKQMLDMSKIEEGKMTVDLIQDNIVSYLQYVLESFQSMADAKNIKLVFYHETRKVVMDYDQDKVFIIASNLLSNAIKFTPVGGKVIFHVKREEKPESDHFIMKVHDSGIGIEEQYLQHIFDRFYQVDNTSTRKGEGTGIGLALTKELVELLNGEITVRSHPGSGTEFCVSLPVTNNAAVRKSKPLKTKPSVEQVSTVDMVTDDDNDDGLPLALVVEDNPDVAKYIMSCLTGKYRVKWSPDGKQGIEAAILAIPDIIISDVMMPEKDGFEVCETLKTDERTSHIPIILLTAKATDKDRIEGLSHGADAYLTKPFNKEELFVRLEQLIKIRRQLQEKYGKVEISLAQIPEPAGEERFLKKAIEAIEKHLDNPDLDPVLLAESLNLSESQLYRKLKALNGKSTGVFIRSIRLSAAKELLTTKSMNISEVAYRCGFSNPAWFSRAFKDEFGISPSKYIK